MIYRYLVRGTDACVPIELTEEHGFKFGTTSEDLRNGLIIKVTQEQIDWYEQHRTADVYEMCDMKMYNETNVKTRSANIIDDLNKAREEVLYKIRTLDSLSQIFYINGFGDWFNKNKRAAIVNDINACIFLQKSEYSLYIAGNKITVGLEKAKEVMSKIEEYAKETFEKVTENSSKVENINSIEELSAFNIYANFPKPLQFTI